MAGVADPGRPAGIGEDDLAAFADLNVDTSGVEPDAPVEDHVEVWDVNWSSLKAFLGCETQWRVTPVASDGRTVELMRLGLDYAGVNAVLDHRRPRTRRAVFADLQVMETAALDAFAEARRGQ